jgi:hypothetical protein
VPREGLFWSRVGREETTPTVARFQRRYPPALPPRSPRRESRHVLAMDASVGDEQHPESDAAAPPESFEAGAPLTTAAATTSKPLSPRLTHPKQWEMFQRIDTDGSGQLDEDEMFAFFADYADDGIANALIEALDRDGDSLIDFEEFCAGWQRYFGGVEGEVATVAEVQAAVRLQASIRGRQARKSLGTKPDAAATIQGATRRYLATSRAKRFVHALTAQQQARKRQNGAPSVAFQRSLAEGHCIRCSLRRTTNLTTSLSCLAHRWPAVFRFARRGV